MLNSWAATTDLCERVWRGLWRWVLAVHEFSFWAWVRRQAYPDGFVSSDRYDRWLAPRYDKITYTEMANSGANPLDRYSR